MLCQKKNFLGKSKKAFLGYKWHMQNFRDMYDI